MRSSSLLLAGLVVLASASPKRETTTSCTTSSRTKNKQGFTSTCHPVTVTKTVGRGDETCAPEKTITVTVSEIAPSGSSCPTVPTVTVTPAVLTQTVTTTTTASTCGPESTESPSVPLIVPPYRLRTCNNIDPVTGNSNTFPVLDTFPSDELTLESCALFCDRFFFFGVVGGNTCQCGNVLNVRANTPDNGFCNTVCTGDDTQFCGGPNHVLVYEKDPEQL